MNQSDSACKIMEMLNLLNIKFNNSKNKFLNLAYECRNDVVVLEKFDAKEGSIFSFKKHAFAD